MYDESKLIHQPSTTDSAITELDTPYKCYLHYFTPEFLQKIVDETNLYAVQKKTLQYLSVLVLGN